LVSNDWIALIISFLLALVWLRLNDYAAHRGWIPSDLSRKIIHIGTGPIYVLTWLFFSDALSARWIAAIIPLAITLQFLLVGTGVIKDQAAVKAMSRSGDPLEILRGPLFYGIVFVVLTVIFWNNSPIGLVALMLLCGGDGLADVIGKRIKSHPLPWSKHKTWAGSAAMFAGGWLFSTGMLAALVGFGTLPGPLGGYMPAVTLIALAGALVESLPLADLDNITVPAVAVVIGSMFWG